MKTGFLLDEAIRDLADFISDMPWKYQQAVHTGMPNSTASEYALRQLKEEAHRKVRQFAEELSK